jgi:cell division GTPase FtsZ
MLCYLQQKTNSQIEIVSGVITDKRMQGRAQVTLVITGIGGTAVNAQKFARFANHLRKKSL